MSTRESAVTLSSQHKLMLRLDAVGHGKGDLEAAIRTHALVTLGL